MTTDEPNIVSERFNTQFVFCQDAELPPIGVGEECSDFQLPNDVWLIQLMGRFHFYQYESSVVHAYQKIWYHIGSQLRGMPVSEVAAFIRRPGDQSNL